MWQAAPDGSIFLLHECAHNPTGIDPTPAQWEEISDLILKKTHFVFFDCAYQGFASGDLEKDNFAIRLFLKKGIEFVCSQSFAKNMGLYAERIGAFHVFCRDESLAKPIRSQLKLIFRPNYSNPPLHGALIAHLVLSRKDLREQWEIELKKMAGRIHEMRVVLFDALKERGIIWRHIQDQIGMFSFTGLGKKQVECLTQKHHIYLTEDGRISMPSLNKASIPYLADAIKDVITSVPKL